MAILFGKLTTGTEVADMAKADWSEKFKTALDMSEQALKQPFDQLVKMRKEIRNYVAHGSFGKDGEAFSFHSGAGAIRVLLPHKVGNRSFSLGPGEEFNIELAFQTIEDFINILWSGTREPTKVYIYSDLPSILSMLRMVGTRRPWRHLKRWKNWSSVCTMRQSDLPTWIGSVQSLQ